MSETNTKENIIENASKVFLKNNYQNMKTAEIARAAGVSEATLYKYFDSKKDIFIAVLKKFNNEIDSIFFCGIEKQNTISKNLYELGKNFHDKLKDNTLNYKLVYKAYSEIEDEDIKIVISETFDIIILRIKDMLQWGVDKREVFLTKIDIEILAMAIWGTVEFVFRKHMVSGGYYDEEKDLLNLGAIFFNLLVK